MRVREMAEGDRGYVHPWDVVRRPDGTWSINGGAAVLAAETRTSMAIECRGDGLHLDAARAIDYGWAEDPASLGGEFEALPVRVGGDVEAAAEGAALALRASRSG
jgi:hypothetical protein